MTKPLKQIKFIKCEICKTDIPYHCKCNLVLDDWIRKHLPDSYSGFRVYDIDSVLWQKGWKDGEPSIIKLMILEYKNGEAVVSADQSLMLNFFQKAVKDYCEKNNVEFLGVHLIRLETGNPSTGKIEFDGKLVDEKALIERLSFRERMEAKGVWMPIIKNYN